MMMVCRYCICINIIYNNNNNSYKLQVACAYVMLKMLLELQEKSIITTY